jgi:hypothetical protein
VVVPVLALPQAAMISVSKSTPLMSVNDPRGRLNSFIFESVLSALGRLCGC